MIHRFRVAAAAFVVVAGVASLPSCSTELCACFRPVVPELQVFPDLLELEVAEQDSVVTVVSGLTPSTTRTVEFISTHPSVASVDSLGVVSALSPGTAQIIARLIHDPMIQKATPVSVTRHEPSRPVRTDSILYTLRPAATGSALELSIEMTYTNRTDQAVYIDTCHGGFGIALERFTGSEWVMTYPAIHLACLDLEPLVIQPEQTFTRGFTVASLPGSPHAMDGFMKDPVGGVYRVVWSTLRRNGDPDDSSLPDWLPKEEQISNRFIIRISSPSSS